MVRLILFFAFVLIAAFGLSWLADQGGNIAITYADKIYEVSLFVGTLALISLSFVIIIILSVLRFLLRLPGLVTLSNQIRRRARGLDAISQGMIAMSSGDGRLAQTHALKAHQLLSNEPLTLLLTAQSAQLAGKSDAAESAFNTMLKTPQTRVMGLRGLYVEARRKGDVEAARHYATEVHKTAPHIAWASQSVLEYASLDGNWGDALKIIDQNANQKTQRQRAVLHCAKALEIQNSKPEQAQHTALEALKLAPNLVPAAVLASRSLAAKGNYKRASKIIETAWKDNPHPDLADAYIDVRRGDSALDRLRRAQNLAKLLPEARESRFMVAKSALEAKEFTLARQNLEQLVLEKPTLRACLMMSTLESQEFNRAGASREWLARAAHAPRDPIWVADNHVSETWRAVSPITGKLDAYEWREPPQAVDSQFHVDLSAELTPDVKQFIKPQPIIFSLAHAPDDPGMVTN